MMFANLLNFLYSTLIHLNIFTRASFGGNIDREKAKSFGHLATRLYIILLILGFVVLFINTAIKPEILTKTIANPSFDTFNDLFRDHSDTLQCPCSSISTTYDQFIEISPIFHQVIE
jgi:hypothetical protein